MIPYDNEMHQKVMNMIYEDANDRKSSETRQSEGKPLQHRKLIKKSQIQSID